MDKPTETHIKTQLQQTGMEEGLSSVEQRLVPAAEARHRSRLLSDEPARLEDLAGAWIELLRASNDKTTG